MRVNILGWAGGIGENLKTTCYQIDDDVLIDAGTGVGEMPLNKMSGIRHIFLTHSHMDHIAGIPLMADSIFGINQDPIIIHAQKETINALKTHIFNWTIWPDFTELPNQKNPCLRFEVMNPGEKITLKDRTFEMIAVNHTVPGVAFCVETEKSIIAFSGDTTTNDNLWECLNSYKKLDMLFVEAAFPNKEIDISKLSKHYCPSLLGEDIKKLKHTPDVWLSHFKPGAEDIIFQECVEEMPHLNVHCLTGDEIFEL